MFQACKSGDVRMFKELLYKSTINICNSDDINIIKLYRNNNIDVLKCILEYCETKYKNKILDYLSSIFICICKANNISYLTYLTSIYITNTNIHKAINSKYYKTVFQFVCESTDYNLIQYYIKYCDSLNKNIEMNDYIMALISGCAIGNINVVNFLIEYNEKTQPINIHHNRDEFFKFACESQCIEMVKYLIYYSEKINSKYDIYNICLLNENIFSYVDCIIKYILDLIKHNYTRNEYIDNIKTKIFISQSKKINTISHIHNCRRYISNDDYYGRLYIINNNIKCMTCCIKNTLYYKYIKHHYFIVLYL